MVGDRGLLGTSSTRNFPLPWLELHGKSCTGILLWSFEGKSLAALRRKCIKLPGSSFHNVLREDGRAHRQDLVIQSINDDPIPLTAGQNYQQTTFALCERGLCGFIGAWVCRAGRMPFRSHLAFQPFDLPFVRASVFLLSEFQRPVLSILKDMF